MYGINAQMKAWSQGQTHVSHLPPQTLPAYRHFTKLCKLMYPWESVSEIQSIKATVLAKLCAA